MSDEQRRDDAADDSATADDTSLSAVSALMEERRQYESWLASLEARRAETPKHVFTRVHADYTARLESVTSKLVSHADGLRAQVTALMTRLATLDEQAHRAQDERAEAELRAHVGELSGDKWKAMIATSDAAIADFREQHRRTEDELRRTHELLADAERPPTPVSPSKAVESPKPAAGETAAQGDARASAHGVPAAPEVSDVAEAGLHVPSGATGAPATASTGQPPSKTFDELAFLQSVVESPATEKSRAPASSAETAVPVRPVARPAPPPPRREQAAPRAADENKIVNMGDATGPKIQPKGGRALAANISGNNPIILRDKSAEPTKTLKCGECGAMNYPTEWYCERCGAELASL